MITDKHPAIENIDQKPESESLESTARSELKEALDFRVLDEKNYRLLEFRLRGKVRLEEPHELPRQDVQNVTDRPVVRWIPPSSVQDKIDARVRRQAVERDWEGEERWIERTAVETAREYLQLHEKTGINVAIESKGGADLVALDSRNRLIVCEVKGTACGTELSESRLTSQANGYLELQPRWLALTDNRSNVLSSIEKQKDIASGQRRTLLEQLYRKYESCRFGDRAAYRKIVFYVGEGLDPRRLKGYDRVVQPEKYVMIPRPMPHLEGNNV